METRQLARIFNENVAKYGSRTALRHRVGGGGGDISWQALGAQVRAVAKALIEAGVGEGESVAIFATNCPEWTIVDLAAQQIRAVSVPIYPTSTTGQAQYIVNDAEVKVIFAGGQEQYDKLQEFFA